MLILAINNYTLQWQETPQSGRNHIDSAITED
jgi:hypothetical protein